MILIKSKMNMKQTDLDEWYNKICAMAKETGIIMIPNWFDVDIIFSEGHVTFGKNCIVIQEGETDEQENAEETQ